MWIYTITIAGIAIAFATMMSFIVIPIMVDLAYVPGLMNWTDVSDDAITARDRTMMFYQIIPFIVAGLIVVWAVINSVNSKQQEAIY